MLPVVPYISLEALENMLCSLEQRLGICLPLTHADQLPRLLLGLLFIMSWEPCAQRGLHFQSSDVIVGLRPPARKGCEQNILVKAAENEMLYIPGPDTFCWQPK